ncbi:g1198 [Coccomyxa viridis]|uniref:Large ribosomal subunit protein uL4m n=1 Tax=Coccomyxa viridis TaxID=1274662 RepID=A0ABP1FPA2_9CHLO
MLSLLSRSTARVLGRLTDLKSSTIASSRYLVASQQLNGLFEGTYSRCFAAQSWAAPKPHRPDLTVPLLNWQNNQVGDLVLPGSIFNVPVRKDILHRVVTWQLAKRRQGTHKTKTRSEVRGGGRKPHPQKGSGRARSGSIRGAQWRGGGIIFGPVVRSHAYKLQKKVRRLGLMCALSAKASEGRLRVLDTLAMDSHKTRDLDERLNVLLKDSPRRSVLMIDSEKGGSDGGEELRRAASNLPYIDVLPVVGANVYGILLRDNLLLSRDAVEGLVKRLQLDRRRKEQQAQETH